MSFSFELCVLAAVAVFVGACAATRKDSAPLKTVSKVEIERYLGTWHEIARYANSFQKDCYGSKANYSLKENGEIRVLNTCLKGGPKGKLKSAEGRAWVVDKTTNAKLKVQFFWPFSGDYWIIDLGKDYEYAVVGEPGRKYLWILSRSAQMDEAEYKDILSRIRQNGYEPDKLIRQ